MGNKSYFFITMVTSIIIIIASYLYWTVKLNDNESLSIVVSGQSDEPDVLEEDGDAGESEDADAAEVDEDVDSLDMKTHFLANKDERIKEKLEERLNNDEAVRVLFIGSKYVEAENSSVPTTFSSLMELRLESLFQLEELVIDDGTMFSLFKNQEYVEKASGEYDFVIIEPFMLNNHGIISYEDTVHYLDKFFDEWAESDALLVVQTATKNNITYVQERYEHLQEYMEGRSEIFVDIWDGLSDEEELTDYIKENAYPNEDGVQRWAEELASYFIKVKGSNEE